MADLRQGSVRVDALGNCQDSISWTSAVAVKRRRKSLAKRGGKDYFCPVVFEDVEIALKNRPSLGHESGNGLFVQCNQLECQYVDFNHPPCPLRLDLFTEEIEKRDEKRRARRMKP
jgi:hypothetical protein